MWSSREHEEIILGREPYHRNVQLFWFPIAKCQEQRGHMDFPLPGRLGFRTHGDSCYSLYQQCGRKVRMKNMLIILWPSRLLMRISWCVIAYQTTPWCPINVKLLCEILPCRLGSNVTFPHIRPSLFTFPPICDEFVISYYILHVSLFLVYTLFLVRIPCIHVYLWSFIEFSTA